MTQALSPLAAMDQAHALHPWTHFDSFEADGAVVLTRGEGVWLWDEAGRRYPVSYTHLTLPTILRVLSSVRAASSSTQL